MQSENTDFTSSDAEASLTHPHTMDVLIKDITIHLL